MKYAPKFESGIEQRNYKYTEFKVLSKYKKEKRAKTNYENFIPPLKLHERAVSKLENSPRPESATLKFLVQPSQYSDPSSIQTFIMLNGISQVHHDCALKIQKAWRRKKDNKIFSLFLHFLFRLYKKRAKYPLFIWQLCIRYPANIARRFYDEVINFLKYKHYLIYFNGEWISNNFIFKLLSFDQYCKLNCIVILRKYDPDKFIKFVKIMMRPLMKEAIATWKEIKDTSATLKKQNPDIRATFHYRTTFKEIFWTYIFWRRWTVYKKTKSLIESSNVCHSFCLPEWKIFRAKKQQKINIIKAAHNMRNARLQRYAFTTMREYSREKIKHKRQFNKIKVVAQKHLMELAFLSFMSFHVKASIKKSLKYRVLSNWYKVTDKSVIQRQSLAAINRRFDLRNLYFHFKKWQGIIFNESLLIAHLFDSMQYQQPAALRSSYLLLADNVHYTFVDAYLKWKRLVWMRRRAKRFVQWSFENPRNYVIKQFLLEIFNENSLRTIYYTKYFPFRSDLDKIFSTFRSKSSRESFSLTKRKRKLASLIRRFHDHAHSLSIHYFPTTVRSVLFYYNRVNDYQQYQGNWAETATSDQVKTLFYRLIIAVSNKCRPIYEAPDKILSIRKFKEREKLHNIVDVRILRGKQEKIAEINRKAMAKRMNRDNLLLAKKDVYLAAVALNKVLPNFQINDEKIYDESRIIRNTEESVNQDLEEMKAKVNSSLKKQSSQKKNTHPMLSKISNLKSGINKSNRQSRRPHYQIFTEETNQSSRNRQIRFNSEKSTSHKMDDILINSSNVYERYQPIKFISDDIRPTTETTPLPPPIEEMPSVLNSQIPKIQDRKEKPLELVQNVNISPKSFSSIIKSSAHFFEDKGKHKKGNENKAVVHTENGEDTAFSNIQNSPIEEEEEEEPAMFSGLEQISIPFVNDNEYMNSTPLQRRDTLMAKYFEILDVLLQKPKINKGKPKWTRYKKRDEENNEILKSNVGKILRRLDPVRHPHAKSVLPVKPGEVELMRRRERKKNRTNLFKDTTNKNETITTKDGRLYSVSNCPEYSSVLFMGEAMLTHFEESESSEYDSTEIPGRDRLIREVQSYLRSSEHINYDLLMASLQGIYKGDDPEKARVINILNKLAKDKIVDQTMFEVPDEITEFVYVDKISNKSSIPSTPISSRSKKSPHKLSSKTKNKRKSFKYYNRKFQVRMPPRQEKTLIIMEKRVTFTQDFVNAIYEGARLAQPIVMQYYDDISKIDPFEGHEKLRETLINRVKQLKTKKTVKIETDNQSNTFGNMPSLKQHYSMISKEADQKKPIYSDEYIISINGSTQRRPPSKIKPTTRRAIHVKTAATITSKRSELSNDFLKIDNYTIFQTQEERPKTVLSRIKQDQIEIEEKNQIIWTPSSSQRANTQIKRNNTLASVGMTENTRKPNPKEVQRIVKPKWVIETGPEITEDDIDFFMFATPFIIPPKVINQLIDDE